MAQQTDLFCSNFSRYFWSEILPLVFIYFHFVWYHFCCLYLTKGPAWNSWGKLLALGSCQNSSSQRVFAALQEHSMVARSPCRNLEVQVPQCCLQHCFGWVSLWFEFSPSLKALGACQLHCYLIIPQHQTVLLVSWRSVLRCKAQHLGTMSEMKFTSDARTAFPFSCTRACALLLNTLPTAAKKLPD